MNILWMGYQEKKKLAWPMYNLILTSRSASSITPCSWLTNLALILLVEMLMDELGPGKESYMDRFSSAGRLKSSVLACSV